MLLISCATAAFLVTPPLAPVSRHAPVTVRIGTLRMEEQSEWEKYLETRDSAELASTDEAYRSVTPAPPPPGAGYPPRPSPPDQIISDIPRTAHQRPRCVPCAVQGH